jgi:hypothetical protein
MVRNKDCNSHPVMPQVSHLQATFLLLLFRTCLPRSMRIGVLVPCGGFFRSSARKSLANFRYLACSWNGTGKERSSGDSGAWASLCRRRGIKRLQTRAHTQSLSAMSRLFDTIQYVEFMGLALINA